MQYYTCVHVGTYLAKGKGTRKVLPGDGEKKYGTYVYKNKNPTLLWNVITA